MTLGNLMGKKTIIPIQQPIDMYWVVMIPNALIHYFQSIYTTSVCTGLIVFYSPLSCLCVRGGGFGDGVGVRSEDKKSECFLELCVMCWLMKPCHDASFRFHRRCFFILSSACIISNSSFSTAVWSLLLRHLRLLLHSTVSLRELCLSIWNMHCD